MTTPHEHELLSQLAYQSWLDRGKPIGSPEVDWNRALELYQQGQTLAPDRIAEQARPIATPTTADDIAPSPSGTVRKQRRKTTAHATGHNEVPMEVPPTTPTPPPTNPPTKAAGRTTRPKLNPARQDGSGLPH